MTQPWLAELSLCVITDSSHNFWKVSVFNDPLVLRERHSTYWKDSLNSSKCTWRQWLPSLPWALSATSTEAYLTMVWKWATSYFCLCTWGLSPPPPHSTPSTPAAAQTLGGNITTWKTLLTSTYSIPPSFQSRGQESLLSSLPEDWQATSQSWRPRDGPGSALSLSSFVTPGNLPNLSWFHFLSSYAGVQ